MADNQEIDHYDFINAPQFVDFNDLAAQDDPDADRFFETHREEDDFMIPLDINTISPTVQFLYNHENEHYSNEANKAAMAAGLEDVKIEYYASPQQASATSQPSSTNKKSLNSSYGTPLGTSGQMSQASFYTPTGCNEDKENSTPLIINGTSVKKNGKDTDKTPRNVLSNSMQALQSPALNTSLGSVKDGYNDSPSAAQSLMSRLNQLSIVSSDEESCDTEENSPARTGIETASGEDAAYNTFSADKAAYLGLPSSQAVNVGGGNHHDGDATVVIDKDDQPSYANNYSPISSESDIEFGEESGAIGMEMREPVNHLLKMLDAQLNLDDGEEDPRCSIVVAPRVGEQVHWTTGDENSRITIDGNYGQPVNLSYDIEEHEQEPGYSDESSDFYGTDNSQISTYQPRASSVGDLIRAINCEPKIRQFETYGYNPRVGITIPKTPDVAQLNHEKEQKPSARMENFNSNMNACYFEIEAPKHPKSVRRVSSCSDLIQIQQQAKMNSKAPVSRVQRTGSRGLTIPKTPDTMKRSQKSRPSESNASSATSTSSRCGPPIRSKPLTKAGPTVSERLTAARNRQPVKANHYVSMAEAMIKYQKNTPDRFRSLPKGRLVPEKRSNSNETHRRGGPSPDCSMMSSARPRAESFSERNETRNVRNFGNGPVLPKKVDLKPTVPRPFNLSSGTRNRPTTVVPKDEDVVDFKFKARPAPSKVANSSDTTQLPKPRPQVRVTQPQSPHFASDARLRERQQKKAQTKSPEPKQFVKPAAKVSRPPSAASRHSNDDHKTTVTQPFSSSFDARQKEILRRKEEKIKQEVDESKKGREFHANPVPKFNAKLPKKKPVEPTHVEPFKLKSDERGAAYQEAFKKKLEEEEENLRELAVFHAQPADVVHKAPFEPERPCRAVEGPMDFQLATERRAAEREQFDEHIREKEREEEEMRREEQERLEEIQKLEDIERRRQMVHKAQPFKPPKPFQLKSSGKPLTVPQSPAFSALPSQRRIKPSSPDSSIL